MQKTYLKTYENDLLQKSFTIWRNTSRKSAAILLFEEVVQQ